MGDAENPVVPESSFSLGFVDATLDDSARDASLGRGAAPSEVSYLLKELIGTGGQGEVWEAWQSSMRRIVAVKVHRSGNPERFVREAMLTGDLDHPSIVPVLDFGTLLRDGEAIPTVAMVMKRLRGDSWEAIIARERGPDECPPTDYLLRQLDILERVCQAVAYAHSRGVLHLDLKPAQVIVGDFGEVYLCDWGMAAQLNPVGELEYVSPPKGPFGTPGFMAPEQALGDLQSICAATDVYLLGGLVYFIVAGRHPHPGSGAEERLHAARNNIIPLLPAGIPASLCRVVNHAMAASPASRPPSVDHFRREISSAIQEIIQGQEAARLCAQAAHRLAAHPLSYGDYTSIEQSLDRAVALAPERSEANDLRDETLRRHALLAIGSGDLALARVLGERVGTDSLREEILNRESAATQLLLAREAQRVRARHIAFIALSGLFGVLVVSSIFLYSLFQRAETERDRAELALSESTRDLARASIQAAMSHLDKLRPSDARAALRNVPREWRGWEWGYLASRAVPEVALHRPRGEVFHKIAVSRDELLVGGIRESDGALFLNLPTPRFDTSSRWTDLAGGKSGLIAACSDDGKVALFSPSGEVWRHTYDGHAFTRVSPTSDSLVYTADATGSIWSISAPGDRFQILNITDSVSILDSRDDFLVVGTVGGSVWHGKSSNLIESTGSHTAPVVGIDWHPTEPWFVTWAGDPRPSATPNDSRAMIHHVGIPTPVHVTHAVDYALTGATWRPDGGRLMLTFSNTWLHQVDSRDWSVVQSNAHGIGVSSGLHYTSSGSHMAFVSRSLVHTREMQWLGRENIFQVDSRRVLEWVGRDARLYTVGLDGGIAEWTMLGTPDHDRINISPDRIVSLDFAPLATGFVTAQRWGWTMFWSLESGTPQRVGAHWIDGEVFQVRTNADATHIIRAIRPTTVELLHRSDTQMEVVGSWQTAGRVTSIAIHPTRDSFSVGTEDSVYTGSSGASTLTRAIQSNSPVTALVYTPFESLLACGAMDGSIHLLDPSSGQITASASRHSGAIYRLQVNQSKNLLVSASADETAGLWELPALVFKMAFEGTHSAAVTSAFMTDDQKRVLTACEDTLVRVFDVATGLELATFQGHAYGVADMIPAPGGRVLSTGLDSDLRTWIPLPWDQGDEVLVTDPASRRQPSR